MGAPVLEGFDLDGRDPRAPTEKDPNDQGNQTTNVRPNQSIPNLILQGGQVENEILSLRVVQQGIAKV